MTVEEMSNMEVRFWGTERQGRDKIRNPYLFKIPFIHLSHQPSYCLKSTLAPLICMNFSLNLPVAVPVFSAITP